MSTTRQKGDMQIIGYTMHEAEFNLSTMFKRTIQRAFDQDLSIDSAAEKLGINTRTLYRIIKEWRINVPKKLNSKDQLSVKLNRNQAVEGSKYFQ